MAKAKKIEQVQELLERAEFANEAQTLVEDGKLPPISEGPEVDASGRKKKVDIAHEQLEELGLKNKSQVIRYLDANGYSRSAISNFLGVRYQHVRNVLVTPLKKG